MKGSDFIKNISVSFDVSDHTADYIKSFVKDYNKFSKSKQDYVLEIIKNFLISWDPDFTDDTPEERVQQLIKLIQPVCLLLIIKRHSRNFKIKVSERRTNATLHK